MADMESMDLVANEVERELAAQLEHFDSLDSKSGLLLGFSGVLVALAGSQSVLSVGILRICASFAALAALASFWPRKLPSTKVLRLREKYLGSDRRFTKLSIVDTHIEMVQQISGTMKWKIWLLKLAMGLTVVGVVAGGLLPLFTGGL